MLARIQEFIQWLEDNTDFGNWDEAVRTNVHVMLIAFMISDKKELSIDRWLCRLGAGYCQHPQCKI